MTSLATLRKYMSARDFAALMRRIEQPVAANASPGSKPADLRRSDPAEGAGGWKARTKIDLRTAPSSMEQRAAEWAAKARGESGNIHAGSFARG